MNFIQNRQISSLLVVMLFAPLFMGCDNHKEGHRLYVDKGVFMLDSTNFIIASVEFDYARQPRDYWKQRLSSVKSVGANTVMVRVPWTLHEPNEGVYDFEGNNDVREFCRLANELGLLVWLHVGPYSDAHADMGGMPWWLLKYDNMKMRSIDSEFMQYAGRFFRVLGKELADMQLCNGGPIALVQIEESEVLRHNVKDYLSALCDSAKVAGFDNTVLTLAAYKNDMHLIPKKKAVVAVAIKDDDYAMKNFSGLRKRDIDAPMLCYDISRSCSHRWGVNSKKRNINETFLRIFEMFESSVSLNTSSVIGGTSFGHLSGAEIINERFYPYATSYDNGTLITENGYFINEHNRYKEIFHVYASQSESSTDVPQNAQPLISVPEFMFTQFAPLDKIATSPVKSKEPLTMEQCNQGYGAMLYRTKVVGVNGAVNLLVKEIHDNARLFLNGRLLAESSRITSDTLSVVMNVADGDEIAILVDAMGRVGNVYGYKDCKGIAGGVEMVSVDGVKIPLNEWENHALPADYSVCSSVEFGKIPQGVMPGIYRTTFKTEEKGDTYLFVGSWGRGEVWVNGHSLGRFWDVGPQKMLYLPGCWLHDGDNELLVLDWVGTERPAMEGFRFTPVY